MKTTVQLSALAAALLLSTAAFAQTSPSNSTTGTGVNSTGSATSTTTTSPMQSTTGADANVAAPTRSGAMTMPSAPGNGMHNSGSDATAAGGPADPMASTNGTGVEPTRAHHHKKMHNHMKKYTGNAPADNIPTYTNAGSNREAGKANGN